MVSEYLNRPRRSEEEARADRAQVRQEAHYRLSEELSQSLFKIAKEGAKPHQVQAALERCNKLVSALRQEKSFSSSGHNQRLSEMITDVQFIESQLRAMS